MINPIQTSLLQPDGSKRYIIIEPILTKAADGKLVSTGLYKIFKDAIGDETILFTEPKEMGEQDDLPDSNNPDYLGTLTPDEETGSFTYEGFVTLSDEELQQVGKLIIEHAGKQ